MDIRSDDGNVAVYLEPGISATYDINVDDGHIRVDLKGVEDEKQDDHWASGKIEGGEGRIRIRTEDGNVFIGER